MPTFNIIRKTEISKSFRVKSTIDRFTMSEDKLVNEFNGELNLDFDWSVGVIVGASGTGKTTVAKELFGDNFIERFDYSAGSILDDMPEYVTLDQIHQALTSVGFGSPPDWVKPYHVLSNGQQMRCDLARAILSKMDLIAFDEFTSVVDRDVAKIGSIAVQKYIRKNNKQFIAITPHRDVIEYLQPDWVFDTDTFTFSKKKSIENQALKSMSMNHQKNTGRSFGSLLQSITI